MKKLNLYFFDSEDVDFLDMFLFYGTLLWIVLIACTVAIPAFIINVGGFLWKL